MGYFRDLSNQLRINAFVDHLGLALKACQRGSPLVRHHVFAAQKSLVGIRATESQSLLTYAGWRYVVHLSTQIGIFAAAERNAEVLAEIDLITSQAITYRDVAYDKESN